MQFSRRQILLATSLAAVSLGTGPPASAAAPGGTPLSRWRDLLVGTGYDPAAEPLRTALLNTGVTAEKYRTTMSTTGRALWSAYPIGSDPGNITASYARLRTMALAYAQPGTGYTGSAPLGAAVLDGLRWMLGNAYTSDPGGDPPGNWWDWQIGAPQKLLDICCLLPVPGLADHLAAVDRYVPVTVLDRYTGNSTGANRVDLCQVIALRGVLGGSPDAVAAARDGLSPVFTQVRSGDGLYADGSFVQHGCVPSTGGYGAVLLGGLTRVLHLLDGSDWAVTDPARQVLFDSVELAFAPFLHDGLIADAVSGRGIARADQNDHQRGHGVIAAIVLLAAGSLASPTESARWRALAKGWITRDTYAPYVDRKLAVPDLARTLALLADAGVPAAAQPPSSRVFAAMDRAVHRRPDWTFTVAMHSKRTTFYENGNGENLRGWHTGSGMTYWWGRDNGAGQFGDAFWPTVDPYRLPGVTVSRKPLADGAGGTWNRTRPTGSWAGGAADDVAAAVGQHVTGLQSTLTGRKSWFCLDDTVVCLGAGITAADGYPVESVVDNRNLGAAGTSALTVDGVTQPATPGWSQTFTGARWAALEGHGGYVFLGGATVAASRTARTGSWRTVDAGGPDDPVTRRYVTLWHDHGTDPAGASYAYLLLPGASAAATAARSAAPGVTVVANTATVQGVAAGGVRAANFFAAGTCGSISADGPCSVLARQEGGVLNVTVADPTRTATTVVVTLADAGFTTAEPGDGVTVLRTSPTTALLVEVGGTLGAGRTVRLGTGAPVAPAGVLTFGPVAGAYVHDGADADRNFGGGDLVVKGGDAAGDSWRAYVRFAPGLVGVPERAVLWVYGRVDDAAGTHATVTARAVSGAWNETGVTWNSQPSPGFALSRAVIGGDADWIGLDVTAVVAANPAEVTVGLFGGSSSVRLNGRNAPLGRPVLEIVG